MAFTPNLNSSGLASILLLMRESDFRVCKGNIGLDSWSKPALSLNFLFLISNPCPGRLTILSSRDGSFALWSFRAQFWLLQRSHCGILLWTQTISGSLFRCSSCWLSEEKTWAWLRTFGEHSWSPDCLNRLHRVDNSWYSLPVAKYQDQGNPRIE
jgi:hypothetical protein